MHLSRSSLMTLPLLLAAITPTLPAQNKGTYFPPSGTWQHKTPAELGMDPVKLKEAVDFAMAHPNTWDFDKDQVKKYGTVLGALPPQRAATNGVILRHGYIVATFGDTTTNDPVYSVAKSFISTVGSLAFDQGLIKDVNDPVDKYVHDGGYDSPHNAKITWKNHFQQETEWEGAMWGKNADFVGVEGFGNDKHEPRTLQEPGTHYEYNDVRINRLSLSLARVFGKPLPQVLKESIMDPIGASTAWKWQGYGAKSTTEINGKPVESVSGGTRWGGGLWINSEDLARFGLLILNKGNWEGKQLVSDKWLASAVTPSEHGPDYGYLWWLNTKGKEWPSAPKSAFAAVGNGGNIIWIDPEHDIVMIWHWHDNRSIDPMIKLLMASITGN